VRRVIEDHFAGLGREYQFDGRLLLLSRDQPEAYQQ
jgi:hypothetical protein